jgi:chromatin remodeling complex protein RSC6
MSTEMNIDTTSEVAPVVASEAVELDAVQQSFDKLLSSVQGIKTNLNGLQTEIKGVEKLVQKQLRTFRKDAEKRKQRIVNRKPSGFAKPAKISTELATFMARDAEQLVARTEVTQFIINYIRDNKLQNETNRKVIQPDANLTKLLALTEADQLTYFNLQKYMNRHFVKGSAVVEQLPVV